MKIQTEFYTLTPYANLLHIEAFYAWDQRVVDAVFRDVGRIVSECYAGRTWGQLTDTRNWQLGTPDAEWLFRKAPLERIIQNLTHHAVVTGRSEIKSWQLKKLVKPGRKWETRLFEEMDTAREWLARLGYTMTK